MANIVYVYVEECVNCRGRRSHQAHLRLLHLIPPERPLHLKEMDVPWPLSKTETGITIIVLIANRYSELTRVIPTSKTTAVLVGSTLLHARIMLYGNPERVQTDDVQKLVEHY